MSGTGKPSRIIATYELFLHRLEGPRVVEDVQPVHEHGLLDPLPADLVPVGEPVEHDVVPRVLSQVEGLDRDPLHLDPVRLAFVGDRPEAVDDPLKHAGQQRSAPNDNPMTLVASAMTTGYGRPIPAAAGLLVGQPERAGKQVGQSLPHPVANSPSCGHRGLGEEDLHPRPLSIGTSDRFSYISDSVYATAHVYPVRRFPGSARNRFIHVTTARTRGRATSVRCR